MTRRPFSPEARAASRPHPWDDPALDTPHAPSDGLASARARPAEALRESEQRFRLLSEAALEGIVIHDEGVVVDVNPSFACLLGYGRPEVIGRRISEVLRLPDFPEPDPAARERGCERPREITAVRKDGSTIPVEGTARSLTYRGRSVHVVTVRDLSDRKRAEEQARLLAREQAAGTRASFLAEASRVLGASLDYQTTLTTVAHLVVPALADLCLVDLVQEGDAFERVAVAHRDPAVERLLCGRSRLEVREEDALRAVMKEGAVIVPDLAEHASADAAITALTRTLPRPEARSLISVALASSGQAIGVLTLVATEPGRRYDRDHLALATDLAYRAASAVESARLFRAVDRARRTRDDVLGIVAHDLRSPVGTITMAAELLLEGILDDRPAERRRHLEIIRRAADGMNHLISDLLDARRLESGGMPVSLRLESIAAVLANAAYLLRPLAEARGLRLEVEMEEGLPTLPLDADRIQQVLSNLVGNAVKFTPAGGTVTLRARRHADREVRVAVEDSGAGIRPEALPHVFGEFWQGDRTDRRGIGLGLAIAKSIVEAHGGRIWVESRFGDGSTFHFSLPETSPG